MNTLEATTASPTVTPVSSTQIIGRLLSILCTLSFYAGIVVIGLAVFNFIMSLKEQDPERQQKAIIFAIVGAAMMALGTILGFVFQGTGIEEYITYSAF